MSSVVEFEGSIQKFIEGRKQRLLEKLASGIPEQNQYWKLVGQHAELKELGHEIKELYRQALKE